MITRDIVRRLRDVAEYGNIAVWEDDTITVVPVKYAGQTTGRTPLCIPRPLAPVNRFGLPDFALHDEELLTKVETTIRPGGGTITRASRPNSISRAPSKRDRRHGKFSPDIPQVFKNEAEQQKDLRYRNS